MADKHYLVTKDMIDSAMSTSSENPVQNKIIYSALGGKLDIKGYASGTLGYAPIVTRKGSEGSYTYELEVNPLPSGGVNADWSQTDETQLDFIKNKPFRKIGTGLSVVNVEESGVQVPYLTADTQLHFEILDPTTTAPSEAYKNTIALKLHDASVAGVYDEYACVNVGTTTTPSWKWEQIGETTCTVEQTDSSATGGSAIKISGTALQAADSTHTGLLTNANFDTFNNKQAQIEAGTNGNVVTYTGVAGSVGTLAVDSTVGTGNNLVTNGAVNTALGNKQDKLEAADAGKTQVVQLGSTAGTVSKLEVTSTLATAASDATLLTNGAIYSAVSGKVPFATGSTSTAFTIGKDANGYYIEE